MARMKAALLFVAAILLVSTWVPISFCAKKPEAGARKEDIPYIKCQVCEKLASQLYHQVQKKQTQISPKKVVIRYGFHFINKIGGLVFFFFNDFFPW